MGGMEGMGNMGIMGVVGGIKGLKFLWCFCRKILRKLFGDMVKLS